HELAAGLSNRGRALTNLGKFREAFADTNKAVTIYTRLVEQEGQEDLTDDFARSLTNRGTSLTGLGEYAAAVADYDKAIDLYTQGSGIKLAILRRLVKACGRTTGHP
ncbi:MAG TPA: tetratricopeptide repeat protein, partial [Isosphaeraceae bacterium]|nr:tetratricopeptide repeat protein [Isosphaeraceae bacterium]